MTTTKLGLLATLTLLGSISEPNWLAQALARTDPDVDAALVAYEAEDWDLALEHLDSATERHGERPEIHYDRGLAWLAKADKDAAREAFQHGTESDVPAVLASSHYQLGNLAAMDEDWETAITEYIACLRAQPDHQNAKWNLEIALQRKAEQDKKEQEEKDKEDQEKQDEDKQDEDKQDEQDKDKQDQENQDKQDQDKQDQGEQDKQEQDKQEQDEQEQDKQDQQDQQDQKDQQPQQPEEAPAKPIETGDLDAALEQLDRQDEFMLGRPRGNRRPVEKDW